MRGGKHDTAGGQLFGYQTQEEAKAFYMRSETTPRNLDWRAALARGEVLMCEQAALHGTAIKEQLTLFYDADVNFYRYHAHGSRDLFERSPKGGSTSVAFDHVF